MARANGECEADGCRYVENQGGEIACFRCHGIPGTERVLYLLNKDERTLAERRSLHRTRKAPRGRSSA